MLNHSDRRITLNLSNTFWVIVSNTRNVKEILEIYLIEQKIFSNHDDEWYVYHSDLSAMSMTVLYVYHSDLSATVCRQYKTSMYGH